MNIVMTCEKEFHPGVMIDRQVELDETLKVVGAGGNYIWQVEADLIDDSEYDNGFQYDTYVGFVIAAPDPATVWKLMSERTNLGDCDYDNYKWKMRVIGIDITGDGKRIIQSDRKVG
ncbi:hypothetical protein ST201phi2-1p094 [Pseudomonas phage 201phi2-1]|uniref:Uncharacterized protein n=1 Tax=Pseudomonas phage 201phi2-1 TaxID=198110 RepID=B3FIV8_BP201|nr:hypothetical protein ST201phi2-1p094 [Pseudomonas phage 201phi2-1]ABY62927.1 hypothetical protein 201phi2-1p094 [Pseudomonas phage 201phi2-1]